MALGGLIWPFALAFGHTPPVVALEHMTIERRFRFGIEGYFEIACMTRQLGRSSRLRVAEPTRALGLDVPLFGVI